MTRGSCAQTTQAKLKFANKILCLLFFPQRRQLQSMFRNILSLNGVLGLDSTFHIITFPNVPHMSTGSRVCLNGFKSCRNSRNYKESVILMAKQNVFQFFSHLVPWESSIEPSERWHRPNKRPGSLRWKETWENLFPIFHGCPSINHNPHRLEQISLRDWEGRLWVQNWLHQRNARKHTHEGRVCEVSC